MSFTEKHLRHRILFYRLLLYVTRKCMAPLNGYDIHVTTKLLKKRSRCFSG